MESLSAAMFGSPPRGPLCYCRCATNHITAVPINYLVSKRNPNAEAFLVHCERLSMKSNACIHRSLIQLTTLQEAMNHPDGMQVWVIRQELGKLVACSREMMGRVLKMLEGDGYITVAGQMVVVLRQPANSTTRKIKQ